MNTKRIEVNSQRPRRGGSTLKHAAALGLLLALSIPALSAENRPVKSRVAPVYPEIAKRLRIEGIVKVDATIDPDGKVIDAKAVSGNHALAPAAEDAVRKWRFLPAPDQSTVTVEINFTL
jgi:TonB family protein